MHNITLICTRHKEAGVCNSAELVKIIEYYKPEVIFEELTPSTYDACYTNNCWGLTKIITVESDAIKTYLQYNSVTHIPMLSAEMGDDFYLMQCKVGNRNLELLTDEIALIESIQGFRFLNSYECETRLDAIKAMQKMILSGDELFSRAYQCVDNYEYDMLKNIYQYSAENNYNNALMFIGAAHRKTITRKIQEYDGISKLKLNWTFYNGANNK